MLVKIKTTPIMEQFVNDFFGMSTAAFESACTGKNCNCGPRAIIKENDNDYILSLPLPGFKKEEINIDIEDDILIISSEVIKDDFKESFENKYSIPEDVDKNKIEALMEDGILTIIIGKYKELPKTNIKKINIK
jgi:HSP20 family protein